MKAKIQIIRCEGINCDEKILGCYILVNKELSDVITPLVPIDFSSSLPNISEVGKIEIPCDGELKLILKMMNGDPLYMGSVSIKIQSLPNKGFVWLPLYQNIDHDSVHSLGGNISSPRILISILKQQQTVGNSYLYKLQLKKLEFVIRQLEERLTECNTFYDEEKNSRSKLALGYEQLKKQFDEYASKAEMREISMIKLLEKKDKELQDQSKRADFYEHKYDTLSLEKNSLVEALDKLKNDKSYEIIQQLNQDIENLRTAKEVVRNREMKLIEMIELMGKD